MVTELVDGEGFADDVYWSKLVEDRSQVRRVQIVDLEVPVLRWHAHQRVANTATNEQRPATGFVDSVSKGQNILRKLGHNQISLPQRRKGAKKTQRLLAAFLCAFAPLRLCGRSPYSSSGDSTTICTPRVDGKQLITCARSIFVISLPAACHSFTQKVRVGPWTAKVDPSIITGTGSATVPARNVSSNSGMYGLNFSNWTNTALSSISAGGSSTGSSDSSRSRVSVCWFRFLTTGIRPKSTPAPDTVSNASANAPPDRQP